MNTFLQPALVGYFGEIQAKIEVFDVVRELVDDVEYWDAENQLRKAQKNLALTQQLNDAVINKLKDLSGRNERLNKELSKLKDGAITTREVFVRDIGHFLAENKQVQKLKDKISELEMRLHNYAVHGTDMLEPEDQEAQEQVGEDTAAIEEETSTEAGSDKVDETAPLSSVVSLPHHESPPEQPSAREQQMFLYDLDDQYLMTIFAFLDTIEVLHVAASCKYTFKRVVTMFGIESAVALPEWGMRPDREALLARMAQGQLTNDDGASGTAIVQAPATPDRTTAKPAQGNDTSGVTTSERKSAFGALTSTITATLAAGASALPLTGAGAAAPATANAAAVPAVAVPASVPAGAEVGLTKEIVDVLIKKLTAAELMAIMSLAERLKKLTAEKEDLTARLEGTESVRNFLIDKLKAAEMEIRNLMTSNSTLKKQAVSDQEIIGYLDLRMGELESQRTEIAARCQQLQASLDLQCGTHSHREHQLSTELNEYKLKYETLDANFKAQKKVLVKEVKTLRAQIETLTNERNLQANQFRLLREALAIGGGSLGGGGEGGSGGGSGGGGMISAGGVGGGGGVRSASASHVGILQPQK